MRRHGGACPGCCTQPEPRCVRWSVLLSSSHPPTPDTPWGYFGNPWTPEQSPGPVKDGSQSARDCHFPPRPSPPRRPHRTPPRGPALKSPSQGAAPWELVKNTLDVRHESPPDPVHRFVPLSQRGLPGRRPSTDTGGSSFPRGTPQRLSRRPVGPAARLPGSLLEGKRADLDEHRRGEGLHSPPPPGCPSCPLGQQEDLPVLLKSRTVPWQQGRGTTDSSSVSPPHREEPKRPGTASPRVVCSPVGRWPKILKLVASPSPNGIGPLPSVS